MHRGQFPATAHSGDRESWIYTLAPHLECLDEIRICPEDAEYFARFEARATSYVISSYVTSKSTGAVRNLYKLQVTSRTIVVLEGADARPPDPKYHHAHPMKWFASWSDDPGMVVAAIESEIQLDRHFQSAWYLYADGHVDMIPRGACA